MDTPSTAEQVLEAVAAGQSLEGAVVIEENLRGACLEGARFESALFAQVLLSDADLRDAVLRRCIVVESNFAGANLAGADLSDTTIDDCNGEEVNLKGANLTNFSCSAVLTAVEDPTKVEIALDDLGLAIADVQELSRSGVAGYVRGRCSLANADLSRAVLADASFSEVQLDGTCLQAADVTRTLFEKCSHRNTDFSYARVRETRFDHGDLAGSQLLGATLQSVEMACVGLHGVDFRQASL
jgi:uncharacterized protein YjbI with pentapeptide repeats